MTVATGMPPGTGFALGGELQAEGAPVAERQPSWIPIARVRPDYLDVLGVDLLAGRTLIGSDEGEGNVMVDLETARALGGREDVTGRRFRLAADGPWLTVVGIFRDLKLQGLDDRGGRFDVLSALPDTVAAGSMVVAIRTAEPTSVLGDVRRVVRNLDPEQPVAGLETAREALGDSVEDARFLGLLMGALAGLATALASLGIYAVVAFSVTLRRREIAVRMALGAREGSIRRLVLGHGLGWTCAGIVVGSALTLLVTQVARGLLFEVGPRDPVTIVGVVVLILGVAAAASYLPGRRATRIEPALLLRSD